MGVIKAPPVRMTVFVVAATLLIVAPIPTLITWAPHWLASTSGLNANQRAAEMDASRTALLALLAGGIAVVGAIYTARTFALNRAGQITERFTRAVDQLGNDKLDVRLGGIYALERVARESDADHRPIVFVLAAYAREHSRWPPADPCQASQNTDPPEAGEDIKAIVAVLRRRKVERERRDPIRVGLGAHKSLRLTRIWDSPHRGRRSQRHAVAASGPQRRETQRRETQRREPQGREPPGSASGGSEPLGRASGRGEVRPRHRLARGVR